MFLGVAWEPGPGPGSAGEGGFPMGSPSAGKGLLPPMSVSAQLLFLARSLGGLVGRRWDVYTTNK